ncbi:OmpA family protein [Mucilaginibacter sp. PAMB04168]|uniref:OmpA family protein n=1 Tax=Mucilaginibacter sp. PAMB04168 TaxID=3138567 RepID=UPI0031F6BC68
MAELNVQPKSKTPWWLWLILLIVALALLFFFLRGCGNRAGEQTSTTTDSTTTTDTTIQLAATQPNFDSVDFNAPTTTYEEITDTAITVRGSEKYTIYSLGDNVLFAKGESALQGSASNQLKQIAASLEKRLKGSVIGIYGHTDSSGDKQANDELATKRAEAVRDWFVQNSGLASNKISVHSYGESEPVASNATAKGRKLNRSVEIVAIPDSLAR